MAANPQTPLSGLARALIQQKRITEAQAEACVKGGAQHSAYGFILELFKQNVMKPAAVAQFISQTFGYPLMDVDTLDNEAVLRDAVDGKLVAQHQVLPLAKKQNRLTVATAEPTNMQVMDSIRFQTGLSIDVVVVEADKLIKKVGKIFADEMSQLEDMTGGDQEVNLLETGATEATASSDDEEDAPVVKFIQKILVDAINDGASDVHFEPYEKFYRVRIRADGLLREVAKPPLVLKEKIAARIKVISRLDISEKRVPQDGRTKLVLSKNKAIDFRVSTLPTLHGEKIVMRILDPSSAMLGIEALGYEPEQKKALLEAVERPYGMVLVTGPTGSGKTVSLYTCLNILNTAGVNISTAEDPAEINLPGINQVNMNEKAGLTFGVALRAFLRQDPDVIMVGEIRDLETAEIAIKAAQTGHMVLSTLHTNDAPTTLERLRNMGIAPFNIASSVILITAQRLARRLCTCKQPVDLPLEAMLEAGFSAEDLDGNWTPYGPVGCERCKGSGYKGRVGIYQVMPVTEAIAQIIMTNGNSIDIAEQAVREGVSDLRQSGLLKVKQGMTSLEEVIACTNE